MGQGADLLAYMAERERLCRERAASCGDFESRKTWEDAAAEWRALIEQVGLQREGLGEIAPLFPAHMADTRH